MLIVVFPDGTSLTGLQSWVNDLGTVQVTLSNVVVSSGNTYQQMYVYTPANNDLANTIIGFLNSWTTTAVDGYKSINDALAAQLTISSISPNSVAHASPTTITITGTGFAQNVALGLSPTVTVNSIVYPATWVSATSITFAYDGTIAAGTYDILVTNPNGGTFTFHGALTLT